ncbi:GmrSD restriction endonuclease domain-containing protein [Amycolatopsis sp. CA-161197]|uniref:GmrSD restriction endonuclease domain-containing protein n=1 Tax=Amycolatopsis sp. CA-161197 TaxID=3239922 RepID=UPI003D931E03
MEKKFTSDEVPLAQLLDQAKSGVLQLPDFQRGWVWDDSRISRLLASLSVSYPIGAVMTLQTGNPDVRFRPRPLEGIELSSPTEPEFLLLDGQQRITSLYLALRSGQPVATKDSRNNPMSRSYFANIRACINPNADREDAIVSVPGDGLRRTFRGETILDVSTLDAQIEAEMFPLSIVLDYTETMNWQLAYLERGPGTQAERIQVWTAFTATVINPFVQYQVPTIALVRSTPKEAVCQVFENVNTGGVSLTVFELLTATYAADDFNLRDDWDKQQERLAEQRLLTGFEATDFLQILTLLATYDRRQRHLAEGLGDDKAPAVSCKRRDMLRLELADYKRWADDAAKALDRVVGFLHGEHVYRSNDLPYATQLVPLTALFVLLGDRADSWDARRRLQQWYWCGVLGEMYGGSTETRFANDVQDVVAWINGGEEPRTIREAQFQASRLLTLRTRNSAAYKGIYALLMKRGGRGFRTGEPIDAHTYIEDAIDIRHVFPKKWCAENQIEGDIADSVVNKTAIDARTSRRMGRNAPSTYLVRMESSEGIEVADLDGILRSHDIDTVALRSDDFPSFFNARFERLLKQIEEAMGKPVNRAADRAESPFVDVRKDPARLAADIRAVIEAGESKVVEFKSTGRKNLKTGEKDDAMEWVIVKTIAGFMNAYGGTLLVGVEDKGAVVGIEADFPTLGKKNLDGWELWLTELVNARLGKVAAAGLDLRMGTLDGRTVARIEIAPGAKPQFATPAKGDKKPQFFVRINNSTHELFGDDLVDYQRKRWTD